MTISEYTEKLKSVTLEGINQIRERIYVSESNRLLANIKNRIQREGKDSSGNKMQAYSTKPMYATRNQFVKKGSFKAVGKPKLNSQGQNENNKRLKTYLLAGRKSKMIPVTNAFKERKSMYLPGGYKELRNKQGMDTSVKNLTYSGSLMASYVMGQQDSTILLGLDSKNSSLVRQGQEKRNGGKILTATQKEIDDFNKSIIQKERETALQIFNK